jgi:benzil reductase ((S)-benzoin forming)
MPKHLTILTGASRGMGLAMAEQLLQPDALLLCISRQTNAALQAHAQRADALLVQWPLDLSDGATAAAQLSAWLAQQDPRQLTRATLINNAGTIPAVLPLRASEPSALAHALRVGLEAPLQLCAAFLVGTQGWNIPRKVLNISSGLGRRPMASQAAYCAAKAGMDHFTRCMALDEALLPSGAKVCSLAPGVIDTDMQTQLRSADAQQFPDQAGFADLHRQGQLSSPAEAARKVLAFLDHPSFGNQPVADVRDVT